MLFSIFDQVSTVVWMEWNVHRLEWPVSKTWIVAQRCPLSSHGRQTELVFTNQSKPQSTEWTLPKWTRWWTFQTSLPVNPIRFSPHSIYLPLEFGHQIDHLNTSNYQKIKFTGKKNNQPRGKLTFSIFSIYLTLKEAIFCSNKRETPPPLASKSHKWAKLKWPIRDECLSKICWLTGWNLQLTNLWVPLELCYTQDHVILVIISQQLF